VAAGGTSVSYYNPAPIPGPAGAAAAGTSSVSYYNPAPVPDPNGFVAAGVTSVSYFNPTGSPVPEPETAASQMKPQGDQVRIAASVETRPLPIAASDNSDNPATTRRQVRW
jgi:hypothetical protein